MSLVIRPELAVSEVIDGGVIGPIGSTCRNLYDKLTMSIKSNDTKSHIPSAPSKNFSTTELFIFLSPFLRI
jgi:hypothetical protein